MNARGSGDVSPLIQRGTKCRARLSRKLEQLEVEDYTDKALRALSVLANPFGSSTNYQASQAGSILGREVRVVVRTRR